MTHGGHPGALVLAFAVALTVAAGAQGPQLPADTRPGVQPAQLTCIDPHYWKQPEGVTGRPECGFPERERLAEKANFGVAFSGGGTRSASATLGALRGLRANGWLSKLGYISAVSGGGWAALPYVYAPRGDDALLGKTERCVIAFMPGKKHDDRSAYVRCGTLGLIGQSIDDSNLLRCALESLAGNQLLPRELLPVAGVLGLKCAKPIESNDTFAMILGRIFLGDAMCFKNCGRRVIGKAALPDPDRPFLVLGGTVIEQNQNWPDPKLLPLEITPLYAGIRQRLGHMGGSYVETWAYGRRPLKVAGDIATMPAGYRDSLTLQDALAITGSAPYLATVLNRPLGLASGLLGRFSRFFPFVGHWSGRDGRATPFDRGVPHGDGGFTEYMGIMPLLAREVRHIIVVLNANGPPDNSNDLRSLFEPVLGIALDGDKSHNVVFEQSRFEELRRRLRHASYNGPTVGCLRNLTVLPNAFYNIRGSTGKTNVCWVYNDKTPHWLESQDRAIKNFVADKKEFANFPWYATFGERAPEVIDLTLSQVMMLAARSEWNFTNKIAQEHIAQAMGW